MYTFYLFQRNTSTCVPESRDNDVQLCITPKNWKYLNVHCTYINYDTVIQQFKEVKSVYIYSSHGKISKTLLSKKASGWKINVVMPLV